MVLSRVLTSPVWHLSFLSLPELWPPATRLYILSGDDIAPKGVEVVSFRAKKIPLRYFYSFLALQRAIVHKQM